MNYTTLEAARMFGSFSSIKDDPLLDALISSASRTIDQFCGRRFAASVQTSHVFTARSGVGYSDPFDGRTLLLDDDLAEAASAITGSPTVTYLGAAAPYWGILNEDGNWSSPITVSGWWAYSKTPPADIELVCLRLTKWFYELREVNRGDAVVVTDLGAVLLPAALPADIVAVLAPYRRLRLAH